MQNLKFTCPVKQCETTATTCSHCERLADEQSCETLEEAVNKRLYERFRERFGTKFDLRGDMDGVWCQVGKELLLSVAYDCFEDAFYLETSLTRHGGGHALVNCNDMDACIRVIEDLHQGRSAFVVHRGLISSTAYYDADELQQGWKKISRGFSVRLIDGQGVHKTAEYAASHGMA